MQPIQLQTILGRVATKSDGSLSLSFSTPEMSAEESTVLFKLCRINLTMRLTPLGETLEAPIEVKNELQTKTHSARLRGVLFVLFKQLQAQNLVPGKAFETFYGEQMSRIIDDLKAQLDPQ
jgi:hypothetical protein